jgi:hypothetical protein
MKMQKVFVTLGTVVMFFLLPMTLFVRDLKAEDVKPSVQKPGEADCDSYLQEYGKNSSMLRDMHSRAEVLRAGVNNHFYETLAELEEIFNNGIKNPALETLNDFYSTQGYHLMSVVGNNHTEYLENLAAYMKGTKVQEIRAMIFEASKTVPLPRSQEYLDLLNQVAQLAENAAEYISKLKTLSEPVKQCYDMERQRARDYSAKTRKL